MGVYGPLFTVTNNILSFVLDDILLQLPTGIALIAAVIMTPFLYVTAFLNRLFSLIGL